MFDTLLDNIPSSDFKLAPTFRPDIPTPEQVVESINVDGRHGSLTRLGAFKDIDFPIEYNILEMDNIKPQLRKIKGYFFGKKTLQFTDDDVYYKIKSLQITETDNQIEEYGLFTVQFICDPFQYEKNTIKIITQSSTLINIGTVESEPLIKVFGTGNIKISINDKSFQILSLTDYISIDCELKETHRNKASRNKNMVGEYPVFKVGNNIISFTGSITKLEIEPRWRYI